MQSRRDGWFYESTKNKHEAWAIEKENSIMQTIHVELCLPTTCFTYISTLLQSPESALPGS